MPIAKDVLVLASCDMHLLCLNRANGLFGLVDPVASIVVESWMESGSIDEVVQDISAAQEIPLPAAREYAEQVVSSPLFSVEEPISGPKFSDVVRSIPPSEPLQSSVFQLPLGQVLVQSWVPGLASTFERLAPLLACGSSAELLTSLQIVPDETGAAVFRDARYLCNAPNPSETEGRLLELLLGIGSFAPGELPLCYLHAACLSWHGHTLLASAVSGSGKSTLALALCAAGAVYLGDEVCAVRSDGAICGLATAISVKPRGREVAQSLIPNPAMTPPEEPQRLWQVDVSGFTEVREAVATPPLLLFPLYVPETAAELSRLSLPETVTRLLNNGASFGLETQSMTGSQPPLGAWLEWLETVPAYGFQYSDLSEALEALKALFEDG